MSITAFDMEKSPEQVASEYVKSRYGNSPLAELKRGPLARLLKEHGISPYHDTHQGYAEKEELINRARAAGFDPRRPADQTPKRMQNTLQKRAETAEDAISALPMPQVRKLAKKFGIAQTPKDKREDLLAKIKEFLDGEDAA